MVTQILIWDFNFLANSYGEIIVVLDPLLFSQEKVAHVRNKKMYLSNVQECLYGLISL